MTESIIKNGSHTCEDEYGDYTLYTSGYSYDTSQDQLIDLYKKYGTLIAVMKQTKQDGSFNGVAFIKYENRKQAQSAINDLNNTVFRGKKIHVRFVDSKYEKARKKRMSNRDDYYDDRRRDRSPLYDRRRESSPYYDRRERDIDYYERGRDISPPRMRRREPSPYLDRIERNPDYYDRSRPPPLYERDPYSNYQGREPTYYDGRDDYDRRRLPPPPPQHDPYYDDRRSSQYIDPRDSRQSYVEDKRSNARPPYRDPSDPYR